MFTRISIILLFVGVLTISANVPSAQEVSSNTALADGQMSYKQLVTAAEEVKGEKLTFKEKVALRVFGKKIQTISKHTSTKPQGEKSQLVALLLAIFIGGLGIHRFYLGYTWQGVVQLLTGGGCGIWTLIDIIRIAIGSLQPKDGKYDKTL